MIRGALLACALLACGSTVGSTSSDASAAVPRDASCSGQREPTRVEGVDPATGCPRDVVVTHVWSGRRVCDRIEPACAVAPACRFSVRVLAPALAGCRGAGLDARYTLCRCEFGVVECPSRSPTAGEWPGCVNNSAICFDCEP